MAFSRPEHRARATHWRETTLALRELRKGSGWRLRDRYLYRETDGWFISVYVWLEASELVVDAIPMNVINQYWQIVWPASLKEFPLLVRARDCRPPQLLRRNIPELDAVGSARFAIEEADAFASTVKDDWPLERFLSLLEGDRFPNVEGIVSTLLVMKRYEEARIYCERFVAEGADGDRFNGSTFPERVLDWMRRPQSTEAVH